MQLKSRRLEALFGVDLDRISADHVGELVAGHVPEDSDLDFKQRMYESGEKGNTALASDVAAMANTRGGLIVIGIAEDRHSRASSITPIVLDGSEVGKVLQIVAARVSPLPEIDVNPIPLGLPRCPEPSLAAGDESRTGFLLIAIARSPRAPLAVRTGESLRYSRRVGPTTYHMSEPEVSAAYRRRDLLATRSAERLIELRSKSTPLLDLDEGPWLVVTSTPEIPGTFRIDNESAAAFQQLLIGSDVGAVFKMGASIMRVRVSKGRIWADGEVGGAARSRWLQFELYDDGSAFIATRLPASTDASTAGQRRVSINDVGLAKTMINSLVRAADHALLRSSGGGDLLLDARILAAKGTDQIVIVNERRIFAEVRSTALVVPADLYAEAFAPLDQLVPIGPTLLATAGTLLDQLAQALGIPELGLLGREGNVRDDQWDAPSLEQLRRAMGSE